MLTEFEAQLLLTICFLQVISLTVSPFDDLFGEWFTPNAIKVMGAIRIVPLLVEPWMFRVFYFLSVAYLVFVLALCYFLVVRNQTRHLHLIKQSALITP